MIQDKQEPGSRGDVTRVGNEVEGNVEQLLDRLSREVGYGDGHEPSGA